MGTKIIIDDLLRSLTSEQKEDIVQNGSVMGHKHYINKYRYTKAQIIAIFKALGVQIDRYAMNKRKSIKLPGSKR